MALWGIVVALAAAVIVLYLAGSQNEARPSQTITKSSFGGPFTLTGSDGQPFPSTRLAGKPHAVFFGFTHCPDVCPTTLARLVRLRNQLDNPKQPFEIVFITVDPERDSPAEMGRYAELFGSPVIGLTGSPAQIAQVKRQYGIFSEKVPDGDGGYTVDHTASVLLFDRNGDFVATISPDEPDSAARAKLERISA